jgi:hypothetical protein
MQLQAVQLNHHPYLTKPEAPQEDVYTSWCRAGRSPAGERFLPAGLLYVLDSEGVEIQYTLAGPWRGTKRKRNRQQSLCVERKSSAMFLDGQPTTIYVPPWIGSWLTSPSSPCRVIAPARQQSQASRKRRYASPFPLPYGLQITASPTHIEPSLELGRDGKPWNKTHQLVFDYI